MVTTAERIKYRAKLHVQITQLLCNAPPAPTARLCFLPALKPCLQPNPPSAASSLHQTVKCIKCRKKRKPVKDRANQSCVCERMFDQDSVRSTCTSAASSACMQTISCTYSSLSLENMLSFSPNMYTKRTINARGKKCCSCKLVAPSPSKM